MKLLSLLFVVLYLYALPASAAAGKKNTDIVTTFPDFSQSQQSPLRVRSWRWLSRLFMKRPTRHSSSDAQQQQQAQVQPSGRPTRLSSADTKEQKNSRVEDGAKYDDDDDETGGGAAAAAAAAVGRQLEQTQQYSGIFTKSSAAISATVSAGLKNLLSDKNRLGRWTASGLQVGLVLYLAHSVWKALVEVMEEYSQEITGTGTEPPFVKPELVERVLKMCEQHTTDQLSIPLPLLQLIHRLLASGLPLRSTLERPTSVESVLSQLTRSESNLLQQCLWTPPHQPSSSSNDLEKIQNMWTGIAGLFPVKESLLSTLASLQGRNRVQQAFGALFQQPGTTTETGGVSSTIPSSSPNGILLYGPPGCGKTLLVRALATTARLPCLIVTPSTLLRKYVGETNSQVRNLFSLAQKLAPCIVCIDELDGLFRERNDNEHEVSRDLKTEFLQWWDGMLSDPLSSASWMALPAIASRNRQPILVIGASNRPFDVDSAVLRRLSQSHFVGLPDVGTRSFFLRQLLDRVPSIVDVHRVAMMTEGYSPSDLRQLLQAAVVTGPMRESTVSCASSSFNISEGCSTDESKDVSSPSSMPHQVTRPLTTDDVLRALHHTPSTPMSNNYRMAMNNFVSRATPSFTTSPSHTLSTAEATTKWETEEGTFYHIGQLELDPKVFDVLSDIASEISNNEDGNSDDGEETDLD